MASMVYCLLTFHYLTWAAAVSAHVSPTASAQHFATHRGRLLAEVPERPMFSMFISLVRLLCRHNSGCQLAVCRNDPYKSGRGWLATYRLGEDVDGAVLLIVLYCTVIYIRMPHSMATAMIHCLMIDTLITRITTIPCS